MADVLQASLNMPAGQPFAIGQAAVTMHTVLPKQGWSLGHSNHTTCYCIRVTFKVLLPCMSVAVPPAASRLYGQATQQSVPSQNWRKNPRCQTPIDILKP